LRKAFGWLAAIAGAANDEKSNIEVLQARKRHVVEVWRLAHVAGKEAAGIPGAEVQDALTRLVREIEHHQIRRSPEC
jgi:hypothetical protein